jgi:hypothetical protein
MPIAVLTYLPHCIEPEAAYHECRGESFDETPTGRLNCCVRHCARRSDHLQGISRRASGQGEPSHVLRDLIDTSDLASARAKLYLVSPG